MGRRLTNIHSTPLQLGESYRGEAPGHYLDLSGEHLGVRIEEAPPGTTSSVNHYHTAEEEHVIALQGEATLHLGDEAVPLQAGDHVCFPAGEAVGHHIENTSEAPFRFLIIGERKQDDVVFYPKNDVVLVKSKNGHATYDYKAR
ncbi:MAG: cupin domain-containing protein [Pseudomonadota bacterium]